MAYCRHPLGPVPECTAQLAKQLLKGKEQRFLVMAESLDDAFSEGDLKAFYPDKGQWGIHPVRICMLLLLQASEGLTDQQVAEAVRLNIGWKYVLRLPLDDLGWSSTVLTDARERFCDGDPQQVFLDSFLNKANEKGLLNFSKQRVDSTHIIACVRSLNRVELVLETTRNAIEALTEVDVEWLSSIRRDHWLKQYYLDRPFNYRLPKKEADRIKIAEVAGNDGFYILDCIEKAAEEKKNIFKALEAIQTLEKVLEEQFSIDGKGKGSKGKSKDKPKFRDSKDLKPSGERIVSPHETEARKASKGAKDWSGYKCHTSETCVQGFPNLITHVATEVGTLNDSLSLESIVQSLQKRGFAPLRFWMDSGYVNVEVLSKIAKNFGMDIVARLANGHSWQSKASKGFENKQFVIDWSNRQVTCPAKAVSVQWKPMKDGETNVYFSPEQCSICPFKTDCTKGQFRILKLKSEEIWRYMQQMRERQETPEFKKEYSTRAGVEGLQSQMIHKAGRRSSVRGKLKTHLKLVLAAAAVNLSHVVDWKMGKVPSKTRRGKFEAALVVA